MSETVYPVQGGLEDWAYGAAWDNKGGDGTHYKCHPRTYPLAQDSLDLKNQENVKSLIYLIETDSSKKPEEWTLGGRMTQLNKETGITETHGVFNENIEYTNYG